MDFDFLTWNNLMYLIGEVTVLIIVGALISAFILVIISLYSIKKGRLYFPTLIRSGLVFFEGLMKAFFRLFGLEDREMLTFLIKLHNTMNTAAFRTDPGFRTGNFHAPVPALIAVPCTPHARRAEMPELRPVHDRAGQVHSRKNGLPDFYRSRLFFYQTDGEEVSPESDHRCRLSF